MKIIKHSFGADLEWIDSYAKQFGGKLLGNAILVPEEIHSGIRYFADCGDDAIALYINVQYNTDIHFIQKNIKDDFIAFYYDLNQTESKKTNEVFCDIGRFGYNLSIIDGALDTDYSVHKGSSTFILCIFIKKLKIKQYIKKTPAFAEKLDKIMDSKKNIFIKFDRISLKSNLILKELQNETVGTGTFSLRINAAVHLLISDYLDQMTNESIVIEKINYEDVMTIINIQNFLFENYQYKFPSITALAKKANMSETKFKRLFIKISGTTPHIFFTDNKLFKAKELLSEKRNNISEIAAMLNFESYSYFIAKFKKKFGISPLTFLQKA